MRHGHLALDKEVRVRLLAISAATIDRMLAATRAVVGGGQRRHNARSLAVRSGLPVRTYADWGVSEPGYLREDIPPLFGARFSTGNWNAGIVRLDNILILLTTLKKGELTAGSHYKDHFLGPDRMQWQSQTQTRRNSQIGRMLSGADPPVRPERKAAQRQSGTVPLLRSAGICGLGRR
jgi:hypothetical protein